MALSLSELVAFGFFLSLFEHMSVPKYLACWFLDLIEMWNDGGARNFRWRGLLGVSLRLCSRSLFSF